MGPEVAPEISLKIFSGEKPPTPRGIQDIHFGAALPSPELREAEQLTRKVHLRPVTLSGRVGLLGEELEMRGGGGVTWRGGREQRRVALALALALVEIKGELER